MFQIKTLILMCVFPTLAFAVEWAETDASILLPLPHLEEVSQMLSPASGLIPQHILDRLPRLLSSREKTETYRDLIKVIAFRIDPCFREGDPRLAKCHRQVRIVWQPLLSDAQGVHAKDAAVHSFYEFGETEWSDLLSRFEDFHKTHSREAPGFIPAALIHEGYRGKYWADLKTLLLKFCNSRTLSRVTLMALGFNENEWDFRGYNIINGEPELMIIPAINQTYQSVSMQEIGTPNYHATIFPNAMSDWKMGFYADSLDFLKQNDLVKVKNLVETELQVENPNQHNSGTIDCASCHLAEGLKDWAQANLQSPTGAPFKVNTARLRAFGYFEDEPQISQRFLNENAAVIRYLQKVPGT